MGYIDKTGAYYEGDMVPGDRVATEAEQASEDMDRIKAVLVGAVQQHLDTAAQTRGYDDIKSAVTYADEPVVAQFQADGRALRAWRSLVWAYCYSVMAQVEANAREAPTATALISELPGLDWP